MQLGTQRQHGCTWDLRSRQFLRAGCTSSAGTSLAPSPATSGAPVCANWQQGLQYVTDSSSCVIHQCPSLLLAETQ